MNIYVTHSKKFDFHEDLYKPLRSSPLNVNHQFFLPHEFNDEPYDSKNLIFNKGCDLIIAEISYPSTGQGIELGWSDVFHIPIVCVYMTGAKISSSLTVVSHDFIEYGSPVDLISKLSEYINAHAQA